MAKVDEIFKANCRQILEHGFSTENEKVRAVWEDGTPAHTIKTFGVVNRYNLQEEFPLMTLRYTNWKAAIDEILWIWQKKSNNVNDLNSHIWDSWADESGSIGKAYGYQLGVKYKFPHGEMDQVDNVLWQLKNTPASRRIMTNIYNFADLTEMGLEPCAYSMTFNVTGNRLNGILNQRSQDTLTANNWNVVQYSALLMMFAQVSGLEPGELVHVISDMHIYDRHIDMVKTMLDREPLPAPKGIGKDGDLLQRISADMKYFREKTTGNVLVMGRKTLESFPNKKPLPNRVNIVLTKNKDYQAEGVVLCHDLAELPAVLKNYAGKQVFVAGGGTVYAQLLPQCERAYVTKIYQTYPADTAFPNLDENPDWELEEKGEMQEEKGVRFSFVV